MRDRIINCLKANQVETYLINISKKETAELFFIKKDLDMRRATDTTIASVTVYRDFEQDGKTCRGNAKFVVEPEISEEELDVKCKRAYMAAGFAPNEFYEIAPALQKETILMESDLCDISMEEAAAKLVQAVYSADTDSEAFVNNLEVFINRTEVVIINSEGVDVSYVKYDVDGEFVAQCKKPQDVETYKHFEYETLETEALTSLVKDTLQMTKDRAIAENAPKAGNYDIILSDEYVATIFEYYSERSDAATIFMKYSDFEVGKFAQAETRDEVTGTLLDIDFIPNKPYSMEGVALQKLSCFKEGVFQNMQTSCRYAHYLKVPLTGSYSKIAVTTGDMSFEEMKKRKGLYVVNFSDFQMDSMSGYYGGEIRLAYLNDGEKITPVTGGSINGSILEAQKSFVLSKEEQNISQFQGPKAILLKNVSVAGE